LQRYASTIARETDSGCTLEHLALTPRGGKHFEAWFDQDSHLLARVTYDTQYFHYTETYSDYRRAGAQILPHQILIDRGLGADGVNSLTLIRGDYGGHGTSGFVHYDKIAIGNLQLLDQIGFATDIHHKGVEEAAEARNVTLIL
jgi:hypothetical protein